MRQIVPIISALVITHSVVAGQQSATPPRYGPNGWVPLYCPKPEYPEWARARHLEGSGVFLLRLRPNGSVKSVEVAESTGHAVLDRSCVLTFREWRFQPGFAKSIPQVKIPIRFTMDGARYGGT